MHKVFGRVESYLLDEIRKRGAIHLTLLDPEKTSIKQAAVIANEVSKAGSAAIMVGSSTLTETRTLDRIIKTIKGAVELPVIIFPNNIAAVSRYADAIWFMSLLNSFNPYFIIGVQALASSLIKKYDLEAIPLGYIIVGKGGAAGIVGQATPLPPDRPEIITSYALAAELLGMHFIYLEAGSGAVRPIPPLTVSHVRKHVTVPLIVGGGITTKEMAYRIVKAGADIIVTGTLVEQVKDVRGAIESIVKAVEDAARKRCQGSLSHR